MWENVLVGYTSFCVLKILEFRSKMPLSVYFRSSSFQKFDHTLT